MPELDAFQDAFVAALRDRERTPAMARWLAGDAEAVARGLAIHRANVAAAAAQALSAAYPVIRQVVGDEYFAALARDYQRAAPSTSGDLADFGDGLAAFVAGVDALRTLPWLSDLARVEWAVHRAASAADAPAWDPTALAAVDPARQAAIRLHWAPGLALVASPFPVVRLWQLHQVAEPADFGVDWTAAETALVARDGFAVTVDACGAAEARFIAASLDGAPLGDAADAALRDDPGFDLAAVLGRAFAARRVCGFEA